MDSHGEIADANTGSIGTNVLTDMPKEAMEATESKGEAVNKAWREERESL